MKPSQLILSIAVASVSVTLSTTAKSDILIKLTGNDATAVAREVRALTGRENTFQPVKLFGLSCNDYKKPTEFCSFDGEGTNSIVNGDTTGVRRALRSVGVKSKGGLISVSSLRIYPDNSQTGSQIVEFSDDNR